jgi:hypothetical protein
MMKCTPADPGPVPFVGTKKNRMLKILRRLVPSMMQLFLDGLILGAADLYVIQEMTQSGKSILTIRPSFHGDDFLPFLDFSTTPVMVA